MCQRHPFQEFRKIYSRSRNNRHWPSPKRNLTRRLEDKPEQWTDNHSTGFTSPEVWTLFRIGFIVDNGTSLSHPLDGTSTWLQQGEHSRTVQFGSKVSGPCFGNRPCRSISDTLFETQNGAHLFIIYHQFTLFRIWRYCST
jgi:hypothetical protein